MSTPAQLLEGLNPAQKEAVETTQGPLLIIAGPGSGKTRVITHRIAYLVRDCGISPYRILAVTFTNKAAREMRERVQRLVGPRSDALTLGTFHAFCALMLRQDGGFVGLPSSYTIYDAEDQLTVIKEAMELAEVNPRTNRPQAVRSVISRAKSLLMDSQALARHPQGYFEELSARVYFHYEELLARNNAADFDDLLMKAVQLLQDHEQVRERYQDRYLHLMVDEFQDTNVAQYRLARLLAGEHRNICVVGDPDQSIYSWRSADIRNILSFQQDYPDARTVSLEQNYRSTGIILEAAKGLIAANGMRLDKDLFTQNSQGAPIVVHEAYDQDDEATYVVGEVDRLVRQERFNPGDCAVMYRVNAQSRALEEACLHRGMKYRLVGGVRFYQRREVKDLMAYLRLLYNPLDEVSLGRIISVPPRGIGAKSLQELVEWAREQNVSSFTAMQRIAAARLAGEPCPVPLASRAANSMVKLVGTLEELAELSGQLQVVDLIDRVLEVTGFRNFIQNSEDRPEERWDNILELRETAQEFNAGEPPDGLASLLERLALVADVDQYEDADDSMTLITLHQAKGLEFPVVFIVGLEEGLLPHIRSMENEGQMEEERRLCYVGITRAQQRLYLLRAFRRGMIGGSGPTYASRFLREVPSHLMMPPQLPQTVSQKPSFRADWGPSPAAQPPAPARPSLGVGDLVRHASFGEGVVMECIPSGADQEITVQFSDGVGEKRLLLSFARLEKIEG